MVAIDYHEVVKLFIADRLGGCRFFASLEEYMTDDFLNLVAATVYHDEKKINSVR
jgi:hypothetical protein